jgi:hypothetical protein
MSFFSEQYFAAFVEVVAMVSNPISRAGAATVRVSAIT